MASCLEKIALGMTIGDIEQLVGPCAEDNEDNLTIYGLGGLCFEVAWRPTHSVPDLDFQMPKLRFSPITWFIVYAVRDDESTP